MYDMRESWIPAYFRDKPMYGLIRTTSRSESENFFFSHFHQSGSSLCQFYIRFESAMDKQRSETKRLNHECRSGKPALVSKLYLEDDASELYTRSVFYKVQEEILAARDDMRIQTGNDLDKLKQVNKSIQGLNSELGDASGGFTKQDFMANLIGKRPTGDISIQPPLQCKNKGSGLKRIVGEREKAINQAKKKARKCKLCSSTFHDQRTCPAKKKVAES
ncbi:hypothetical protein DCAR_0414588 [Daucus carota subsp. sativus]|uniref:Protein FAR1-RELATED SEQUENCE n=1 Tax=Daucus carota subsp. sativus TaxID=79200 RepID=A0AAF0WUS8_DAUCS|nr:hypothetical protein DCAR_0205701 [Daucus carota subsp. sativus]WOG95276.1 hypothetical protein DCAR_0414588 [Daucus carota subsp. sativus]